MGDPQYVANDEFGNVLGGKITSIQVNNLWRCSVHGIEVHKI